MDEVGHQHVGVQVGVTGPAGAVAEGRRDGARGADLVDTVGTSSSAEGVGLEVVGDGRFDGRVMGGGDASAHLVVAEGEEEGDRLGGRIGVIEARHRASPGPPGQQVLAGAGIGGVLGDRAQVGAVDVALEAELGGAGADPLPGASPAPV